MLKNSDVHGQIIYTLNVFFWEMFLHIHSIIPYETNQTGVNSKCHG